jgi:hypothetical protein
MRIANLFVASVGLTAAAATSCIDPDSPLISGVAEGCDEFAPGADVSRLGVDARVKSYLEAASDFTQHADELAAGVFEACEGVALDLGAENTWHAMDDLDDKISNANGTGACDAAGRRIEAIMLEARRVDARVAITVTRGACHPDFEAQAECDQKCAAEATCTAESVVERCEPGALSVHCEGECVAGATCEGKLDLPANCMGKCEAECVGACQGECIAQNGTVTVDDPNCVGKCASACNGECRGECKIQDDRGVACGAEVRCTGGCTGEFTLPVCTTEFLPPRCGVDTACHRTCSAEVLANAPCEPTQVRIYAEVAAHGDVAMLVDTLERHMPTLIDAADVHGRLLLDAADRLGESGKALESDIEDLSGKSLACLAESTSAVSRRIGMLDASVNASVEVTVKTTENLD